MDEKQILLVKLTWTAICKNLYLFEDVFIAELNDIYPQLEEKRKTEMFNALCDLFNSLVLNIHTFEKVSNNLDEHLRLYESKGFGRQTFINMMLAFLTAIEKIHENDRQAEIKDAWVTVISEIAYQYQGFKRFTAS